MQLYVVCACYLRLGQFIAIMAAQVDVRSVLRGVVRRVQKKVSMVCDLSMVQSMTTFPVLPSGSVSLIRVQSSRKITEFVSLKKLSLLLIFLVDSINLNIIILNCPYLRLHC